LDDNGLFRIANATDRILITNDKDFGEMVFRERRPHKGIILLRLEDERISNKIAVLGQLFEQHADELGGNFVVVTETTVRITSMQSG